MNLLIKIISTITLVVSVSACAPTSSKTKLSENLSIAPAIDISYSEVNENIEDNIGLNVRWGGKVISSKIIEGKVELTIIANKLNHDSRPIAKSADDSGDERFIVILPKYKQPLLNNYLTVFGQVTGERSLVNGPRIRIIPVVTAIETKEWNSVSLNKDNLLRNSYTNNSASYINYFGGLHNRKYSRFGNFSRFDRFSRFKGYGFGTSKSKEGFSSRKQLRGNFLHRGRH